MPRVGIDLRMVRGRLHGIARYALELARRLPRLAPDWEFVGLSGPKGLPPSVEPLAPQIPLARCPVEFLSPLEQPALLGSLLQLRCDLFHATSFSLPALWRGKLVATLHDVNHLAFPENYGLLRQAYYRAVVGPRARTARKVITVSEFSRKEVAKYLGLKLDELEVIHSGVDALYQPADRSAIDAFRSAHRLPAGYFAAVGNTKAHKNLGLLARIAPSLPGPIALVAGAGAKERLGFPASTVELSELPETEMACFYAGAVALLLPSRYEGFGFPALEAMACGCPVVASRAGSLPELIDDAGILVGPDDVQGWTQTALRLCQEPGLREGLIAKGRMRASHFSWEKCASRVLSVYRQAL